MNLGLKQSILWKVLVSQRSVMGVCLDCGTCNVSVNRRTERKITVLWWWSLTMIMNTPRRFSRLTCS
jgi:hypothetical protein